MYKYTYVYRPAHYSYIYTDSLLQSVRMYVYEFSIYFSTCLRARETEINLSSTAGNNEGNLEISMIIRC